MNKKPINRNPIKEFFSLLKTIEKNTKNQAKITSYNPDDISTFVIEIRPIKGLYQHAKFLFQIQLMQYPREFPNVVCLSDIYHPNIEQGEEYHNVCLNLFDNWNRSFGLIDVVQGLIFLLYQPNLNDPISSLFNSKGTSDEIFRKNVFTSLHGGVVDGTEFQPNPGIVEYNETMKIKSIEEHIIPIPDIIPDKESVHMDSPCPVDKDFESHVLLKNSDAVPNIMTNNNAAQVITVEMLEEQLEEAEENVIEPEEDENLPTRDIVSPNAFYSDLICSRYTQPDKFSETDDSSHLYDAFDDFRFYSGYEGSFYDCDEEEEFTDVDQDSFVFLPPSNEDPSYIFLSKWVEIRRRNNSSRNYPAPTTSIILTSSLNPFRSLVGTFILCDIDNLRLLDKCVYRVNHDDRPLHWMVLGQNLCRWSLPRRWRLSPGQSDGFQLLWLSLLAGLAVGIRQRLACLFPGAQDEIECLFVD